MTSDVRLFDSETIDALHWPTDRRGQFARRYLLPLIKHGPRRYIDNVSAGMLALAVDDVVVPVVLGQGGSRDSNVCSPYSHYVEYAKHEMRELANPLIRGALGAFLSSLGVVLRTGELDRVVFVNNWLLTTNPPAPLSREQIAAITSHLVEAFPDRAIVFRSVEGRAHPHFLEALRDNRYITISSRTIYFLSPSTIASSKRKDAIRDMKLLADSPYEIVPAEQLSEADVPRITRLYRELYLDKYTPLNPQFNERFFAHVLQTRALEFRALRKDGTIDAFATWYLWNGMMVGTMVGYDRSLPTEIGLYRQVLALFIGEALRKELLAHLSAGAGRFKMFRGGAPTVEFDAVYERHLPSRRHLPWQCLRMLFNGPIFRRLSATV